MKYDDFELNDGTYSLPRGEMSPPATLMVWTQSDGQWACVAYDHGTFCRRCQRLDGIAAALLANVIEGGMEIRDDADKGWQFRVNAAGRARVETAIRRGGFGSGLDG